MSTIRIGVTPLTKKELWRPIPGCPAHEASTYGRIRRIFPRKGKMGLLCPLRPAVDRHGRRTAYLRTTLSHDGHRVSALVHILIAKTWIGERPGRDHVVAHWDGDGTNNRIDNLRWATYVENSDDALRHGHRPFGENKPSSKLSNQQVIELRRLRSEGWSHPELAALFDITKSHSCRICCGRQRSRG